MLLDLSELPGSGWKVLKERTWRVGMRTRRTDEGKRAKDAGKATAWRSYEQHGASRWFSVRLIPMVAERDAASYVLKLPNQLVADPRARFLPNQEREIEDSDVGGLVLASATEVASTDSRGSGVSWNVIGHVRSVVVIASCSCYDDAWSWNEAKATLTLQAQKILRSVEPEGIPK